MNPTEVFLSLYLTIPLGLLALRWSRGIHRSILFGVCAILSWMFFNGFMAISPPDNGYANYVYLVSGWFWMLPFFSLLMGLDVLITFIWRPFHGSLRQRAIGRFAFIGLLVISVFCALWGVYGQMSESSAVKAARYELEKRGYIISGREQPAFVQGHWIIRYPDTDFREIRLHRDGSMSWIGGPG